MNHFIGENRMEIRAVVFEFIACRQTNRQTDRRGGGLCFIICIDYAAHELTALFFQSAVFRNMVFALL